MSEATARLTQAAGEPVPSLAGIPAAPAPDRASHARYSMPFFLHFRPDFMIEALPGTVPEGEEPKWPPISSHDYLLERLREIKLA